MRELIIGFSKKNKKILFLIGVFFTLNILSSTPLPYLSKVILDDIIIPKKYELIYKILTIFLVIVFLQLVGNYISNYLSIKFIQDYIYSLKRVLYNKIFSSKCKFNNIDIGNAQIILTNDTTIVASYSYGIFWSVALNSVLIIAYTVIMFAINTKLFFINIIMLPFIVYIYINIGKKIEMKTTELQVNKDVTSTVIYENLFNSREIKVNDILDYRKQKITSVFKENKKLSIRQNKLVLYLNMLLSFIISISPIIIFAVGVSFIKDGLMSIGELITFVSYQGLMFSPLQSVLESYSNYKILKASYNRLRSFIEEIDCVGINNEVVIGNDEISVNNLIARFSWGDSLNVEKFNCKAGEIVCIKGDNGVGKSLFSNVLSGLTEDCMELNGELRLPKNISLLTGESIIYTDSLINNILLGSEYEENRLENIISLLELKSFINNREETITPMSFSSGEKERILFARELYKNPSFLIIDEAFSSIDKKTRDKILDYCYEKKIGLIIISHYNEISANVREVKNYNINKDEKNIVVKEV